MDFRPKKTVRFVSFPPRTPSPTLSSTSDSFGSPPGPSTPPQPFPIPRSPMISPHDEYTGWQSGPAAPYGSPTSYPAFSATPAETAMIDPLLEVLPSPSIPPLLWDVMSHPDSIQLGSAYSAASRYFAQSDLARCAARSNVKNSRLPLRRMVLIFLDIPLEIEVAPCAEARWSERPLPFVTVGDVLYGIYRTLRASAVQSELNQLDTHTRELSYRMFDARLRDDPRNRARNLEYGVRRIDCLGEQRQFLGIRPAIGQELPSRRRGEDVFVVELGHAPLP
ncbi:hypothetical protein C8Q78DRAFT_1054490 [Trametes maxima]|nr:hypothetical protein C8Q78DRAFT_1054490 [Trametes maxima]